MDLNQLLNLKLKKDLKRELKIENHSLILNVARFSEEKDHKTLIKSFLIIKKEIRNIKMIIIGQGPLRSNLKSMIKNYNLGNDVFLHPTTPNLISYYDVADLFLFSSQYEGFGNVVVEAMSRGLPVVTTRFGSLPNEIFNKESDKYVVEVGDYKSLAERATVVLKNKKDKDFYKNFVTGYRKEIICQKYELLLKNH